MMDFLADAEKLLGAKKAEMEQWIYEAQLKLIATALHNAYVKGKEDLRTEVLSAVSSCIARDSTLIKLQKYIQEI